MVESIGRALKSSKTARESKQEKGEQNGEHERLLEDYAAGRVHERELQKGDGRTRNEARIRGRVLERRRKGYGQNQRQGNHENGFQYSRRPRDTIPE